MVRLEVCCPLSSAAGGAFQLGVAQPRAAQRRRGRRGGDDPAPANFAQLLGRRGPLGLPGGPNGSKNGSLWGTQGHEISSRRVDRGALSGVETAVFGGHWGACPFAVLYVSQVLRCEGSFQQAISRYWSSLTADRRSNSLFCTLSVHQCSLALALASWPNGNAMEPLDIRGPISAIEGKNFKASNQGPNKRALGNLIQNNFA
jgi:hypothetical protein